MSTGTTQQTQATQDDDWGGNESFVQDNLPPTSGDELMEFDTEGVDANAQMGGPVIDKKGIYHLEIEEAKYKPAAETHNGERPEIELRCRVCVSVPGQSPQGSVIWYRLGVPCAEDKNRVTQKKGLPVFPIRMSALCAFLHVVGLMYKKDGKYLDAASHSTKFNIGGYVPMLKGRQFLGNINREYDKKDGSGKGVDFDEYHPAFALDDPKYHHVPLNMDAVALVGMKDAVLKARAEAQAKVSGGNGNGAKAAPAKSPASPTSSPAPAAQPAAAVTQYDDL